MQPVPKRQTGVSFETHVLDYLDRVSREQKRSRSSLVNLIIEEHAALRGTPIAGGVGVGVVSAMAVEAAPQSF